MKSELTVAFFKFKAVRLCDTGINEKWGNFGMLFKFGIKVSEFISGVFLINSETEGTEVYSVLNALSAISLMETIYLNKNKIF